jgi:hypothetical protein
MLIFISEHPQPQYPSCPKKKKEKMKKRNGRNHDCPGSLGNYATADMLFLFRIALGRAVSG